MEGRDVVSAASTQSQADVHSTDEGGGEIPSKLESEVNAPISAGTCSSSSSSATGLSKGSLSNPVEPPAPSGVSHTAESPGAVALKVATTVLHPVCLGESPLMLPLHLQMSGAAGAQLSQVGAAPYLITSQSPVSLPLVLDQQLIQHMSPSLIPPPASCPPLPLQNSLLCQNPLTFGLPPAADPKSAGQTQDTNLLSLLQNPAFAAIMQDLFPSQAGSPACPSPGSAFFPLPPLTPPYTSPLAPLVPPATLLVPYPVIIPLPVPLPVPLPIPIPVPQPEDKKGNMTKPVCTVSKSTQTSTSPSSLPSLQPQNVSPSSLNPDEGQALDLSIRACPLELKQEYPGPQQDNVLDLSVPGVRKHVGLPSGHNTGGTPLSLGVECTQSLDSKVLGSLASLEFSRKHKWLVDGNTGGSGSRSQETSLGGSGNLEIVSTSQTAKVIVSVKDGIPAILCGKIKGISGVSTKNFSIKRDGGQGSSLQQLYGAPSVSHTDQSNPNHVLKKVPKSRAIKLKNISSQEIHFLPVKKQRLAALLPRK